MLDNLKIFSDSSNESHLPLRAYTKAVYNSEKNTRFLPLICALAVAARIVYMILYREKLKFLLTVLSETFPKWKIPPYMLTFEFAVLLTVLILMFGLVTYFIPKMVLKKAPLCRFDFDKQSLTISNLPPELYGRSIMELPFDKIESLTVQFRHFFQHNNNRHIPIENNTMKCSMHLYGLSSPIVIFYNYEERGDYKPIEPFETFKKNKYSQIELFAQKIGCSDCRIDETPIQEPNSAILELIYVLTTLALILISFC